MFTDIQRDKNRLRPCVHIANLSLNDTSTLLGGKDEFLLDSFPLESQLVVANMSTGR